MFYVSKYFENNLYLVEFSYSGALKNFMILEVHRILDSAKYEAEYQSKKIRCMINVMYIRK